jgi:RNA polymerase sigma-70 factor (ECF subfamily)
MAIGVNHNTTKGEDDGFASHVFATYSQQLLQLANDHLNSDLLGKISPEDIVQSALKSFFCRAKLLGISESSQGMIWGLLSIITVRKCKKWENFFHCSKRDVAREVASPDDSTMSLPSMRPAAESPSVEDGIVATELIEHLLSNFTPRQQEMILLRIQGLSNEQIAENCKSSLRTVARTIAKAKSILAGLVLDD